MTDSRLNALLSSTIIRPYGVQVPFGLEWFDSKYQLLSYARAVLGDMTVEEKKYVLNLY